MPSELSGAAVSHVAQDGCAVMRRTCYEMFKPLLGEAMKTIDAVVLTSGGPIEGVAAARPCGHERVGVHAQGFHAAHLREVGGQLRGQIRREERPHQRRSYGASYLAEGVEGFSEGSIFCVFRALKRRVALYFCPWDALSPPLVLLATSRLLARNASLRLQAVCRCFANEMLAQCNERYHRRKDEFHQ